MYAARAPCSAGAQVARSSQSKGGSPEREPTRTGTPRSERRDGDAAAGLAGAAEDEDGGVRG